MSSCEGKIRFPKHSSAQKNADRMARRGRGFVRPYRCEACNGYHLTSEPGGVNWQDKFRIIMGKRLD